MPFLETYVNRVTFQDLMTEALDADAVLQAEAGRDPTRLEWLMRRARVAGWTPIGLPSVTCAMPFVTPEGDRAFFTPAGAGLYATLEDSQPSNFAFINNPSPSVAEVASLVPVANRDGEVLLRNLTMFGMGSGFLLADAVTLAGGRGPAALRQARQLARNCFTDPSELWTFDTGGSPKTIKLRPGCYAVVGDSIAGKSTFMRLMAQRVTGPHGTESHFVSWGEPEVESLDGMDIANMLLELSIGATVHRTVYLDSTRYLSLFAAGPAGSKGLSKGLLAWLTAMSRSAAALGIVLIVAVPPFEVAGDPAAYKIFTNEVIGATSGTFLIKWVGTAQQAEMSLRRPLSEGGRAIVNVSFAAGVPQLKVNRRSVEHRLVQP